jgi:hypothetical protein
MIEMPIIGAADQQFPHSQPLSEKTVHDIVSFSIRFVKSAEMGTPVACVSAESKVHDG